MPATLPLLALEVKTTRHIASRLPPSCSMRLTPCSFVRQNSLLRTSGSPSHPTNQAPSPLFNIKRVLMDFITTETVT